MKVASKSCAYPGDKLIVTTVRLPETLIKYIDQMIDVFYPRLMNREQFMALASELVIDKLLAEAAAKTKLQQKEKCKAAGAKKKRR